jgi:hypothetical protein
MAVPLVLETLVISMNLYQLPLQKMVSYSTMIDCLAISVIFLYDWLIACLFCTDVVAAAVLSGNRNFEGRVHPLTRANYLASPPLVVAYALAGTVSSCFLPHNSYCRAGMVWFQGS